MSRDRDKAPAVAAAGAGDTANTPRELLQYISAGEVAEVRRRNDEASEIVAGLVVRAVEFVESLADGSPR